MPKQLERLSDVIYHKKAFTRTVNRGMKYFGDIDYAKRRIRVNPSKGDLLNTIMHEEIHSKHPGKKEKTVRKEAGVAERKLTIDSAISNLLKFKRKQRPPGRLSSLIYS